MKGNTGIRIGLICAFLVALAFWAINRPVRGQSKSAAEGQRNGCVDYSNDPAGCQPSTFEVPWTTIPDRRVGKDGELDPKSSEADDRAGAALDEKKLHLLRNFVHIHWVVTVPSVPDPMTGGWTGGDLDAMGDGRGLGIAGSCIFTGHGNGAGKRRDINIFKVQADPVKNPPVQVGTIPALFQGNQGLDDRELRSLVYKTSSGQVRQIMIRNGTTSDIGRIMAYSIDPNTCLPISSSDVRNVGGQSHEFYLWHDPANSNRVLMYVTIWTAGVPDPNAPGLKLADLYVLAMTDEKTGDTLQRPSVLATFTLEDAGGPPYDEKPDATGLFSDGRFIQYADNLKDSNGRAPNVVRMEWNKLHSISVSDDGERAYVAGTTAGFYILNTEAVAHHTDADLAAGKAGCNLHTTILATNGVIDAPDKLPDLANDCVHMVINDDPGLKAYLASNAPPDAKIERYLTLENRSRFDPYPPFVSQTSTHSAVIVPDRPAEVKGNTKGRPAYVWITDENLGGCPLQFARILSIEQEAFPAMVGAFGIPDDLIDNCLNESATEADGVKRRPIGQQNHNPTVFKNLVFNGWYAHGLRAIDISIPMTPREVGYAMAVPLGIVRTYPVFKDGLIYYNDNRTGLNVMKYTGPRADELPGPGSGVYEGNATSPHQ